MVLVFAGAGWDPCAREELAAYNALLERIRPSGVRLLGIAIRDIWCRLDFAGEDSVRFPLLLEPDPGGETAHRYGVGGARAVFVIDAEGFVRWRHVVSSGLQAHPEDVVRALQAVALSPLAESLPEPGTVVMDRREFLVAAFAATAAVALWPRGAHAGSGVVQGGSGLVQGQAAHVVPVRLDVNGESHDLRLDTRVTLLDALRETLGLTGTKKGCDQGTCGACTVLSGGRRIKSCLTLAAMQQDRPIVTVEGLARGRDLHPVQAAFIEHDAFQCGYCTPGQVVSAVALIEEGHAGSAAEIREWMSGNVCRCGAYPNIVAAILDAASKARS